MPRPKKDNTPISLKISTPILERLNAFTEDAGQSKTTAIERALTMYMDDYYKKQEILNK